MILNDVHESFAWRHDLVSCTKLERFDQWGFHLRYLTQHVVAACVKIIWCAMMPLCLWDIRRMMDLEPWDAFFFCSFSIAQKWQSDTTWMDADWMGTGLGTVSSQHPLSKPRSRARQVWFAQALPAGSGTLCSTAAEHKIIGFWKSKKNIEKPCFV